MTSFLLSLAFSSMDLVTSTRLLSFSILPADVVHLFSRSVYGFVDCFDDAARSIDAVTLVDISQVRRWVFITSVLASHPPVPPACHIAGD